MTSAAVRWPSGDLGRAVTVALLLGGAVVEAVAGPGGWRSIADWLAGASLAMCAEFVPGVSARRAVLLRATAVAWFAGTLAVLLAPAWAPLQQVVVLGYRGPLLHVLWLTAAAPSLLRSLAVAMGYLAALLPAQVAVPASAGLAAAVALTAAVTAQRTAPGRGWAAHGGAPLLLGAVWASAAGPADALLIGNAAALALAGGWVVVTSRAAGTDALGSLAVRLGPSARRSGPVAAVLARLLGDPQLAVRFEVAGAGWVDEEGRAVDDPTGDLSRHTTLAAGSGGSRVALLHGRRHDAETPLARAAASAAALVLDSAAMAAQEVRHAQDARTARERLLRVADAEREALARRLERGPRNRLATVRARLDGVPDQAALVHGLDEALADLDRLGEGLYPSRIVRTPLPEVLARLADGTPLAVDVVTDGDLGLLDERSRALVWFVCSECLTNVVHHAQAQTVRVSVSLEEAALTVTVDDDGRGGASLAAQRGLAGLMDRVATAGGTFVVHSPVGGPTRVTARLPR